MSRSIVSNSLEDVGKRRAFLAHGVTTTPYQMGAAGPYGGVVIRMIVYLKITEVLT